MSSAGTSTGLQGNREAEGRAVSPAEHALDGMGFLGKSWSSNEYGSSCSSRRKRRCLHGNFPAYYAGRRAFVRSHNCSQQSSVYMDRPADGCCRLSGGPAAEIDMCSAPVGPSYSYETHLCTSELVQGHVGIRDIDPRLDAVLSSLGGIFFEGKDVLDIGCNAGCLCLATAGLLHARSVTGVDIDEDLVALANSALEELRTLALRRHTVLSSLTCQKTVKSSVDHESPETSGSCVSASSPYPGSETKRTDLDTGNCIISGSPAKATRNLVMTSAVGERLPTIPDLDRGCKDDKGLSGAPYGISEHPENPENNSLKQSGGVSKRSPGSHFSQVFGRLLWNALVTEATTGEVREPGLESTRLSKTERRTKEVCDGHVPSNVQSGFTGMATSTGISTRATDSTEREAAFPFNVSFHSTDIVGGLASQTSSAIVQNEREHPSPLGSEECYCELLGTVSRAVGSLPKGALLSPGSFDIVICFSVTKWIHLHHGDCGILLLFSRLHALLKPDGILLLEPQDWASYRRARRLSSDFKQQLHHIRLPPKTFTSILTANSGSRKSQCSSCVICDAWSNDAKTAASTELSAVTDKQCEQYEPKSETAENGCQCACRIVSSLIPPCDGSSQGLSAKKPVQPFVLMCSLNPWTNDVRISKHQQSGAYGGTMWDESRAAADGRAAPRPHQLSVDEVCKHGNVTARKSDEGYLDGVFDDDQRCSQAPANHVFQKGSEVVKSAEPKISDAKAVREPKGRLSDRRILVLRKSSSCFSVCCCTLKMLTSRAVGRCGPKPINSQSQS
ncbi:bicoid-interacting protein BIN3 [Toxoplasma gondii VAND]|uniref:RNA methyltransferase n=1 Tax=Toxoplasma gondii VAND TaxID=933077 RepID=A0A086PGL4_TOXGO|nr:bicoid-interacting protein BIN3 [Toxoplasma gondii VAND]